VVQTVKDQTYFHVNSTANLSQYDLMRVGHRIEIGKETNPFFRLYETWQRCYVVRNGTTGQVENVPALQWLRRIRDKNITLDNPDALAGAAFDIGRHFMMLARELVWEIVRQNEFPDAPSRQRCIWLTKTLDEAREWVKIIGFQPHTYWIVRVAASGTTLDVDGNYLAGDSEPLPDWYEKARAYWSGQMTGNPAPETIFQGAVTVKEIIGS
jgi:hypothetical protein